MERMQTYQEKDVADFLVCLSFWPLFRILAFQHRPEVTDDTQFAISHHIRPEVY